MRAGTSARRRDAPESGSAVCSHAGRAWSGRTAAGQRYGADLYEQAAELLAGVSVEDCRPELWPQRCRIAAELRRAALAPEHPQNRALLNGLRFLLKGRALARLSTWTATPPR
jgi:hypothetical protein